MDNPQITQRLTNREHFGVNLLITPPAPIPELSHHWEWNLETGMPIFNQGWRRYLPATLTSRKMASDHLAGRCFVRGMKGVNQMFTINFGIACGNRSIITQKMQYLMRMILMEDVKKINVERNGDIITVKKLDDHLLPYDEGYNQPALRISYVNSTQDKTLNDLIIEVNRNAMHGFSGPLTQKCRDSRCLISGPLMTQTGTVQWGPNPNQVIHVQKRFSCNANSIVYLLHCSRCLDQGLWSTYVGETSRENGENFHNRINGHARTIANSIDQTKYTPVDADRVRAMIAGTLADPDHLLQDPYIHFTFVHQPQHRRYTILDGNLPNVVERRRCENLYKLICGNYVYDSTTNSGSLNIM